MVKTLQELFLIFTSVLFIVDPLSGVPSFLAMTARDTPEVRRGMARRGAWTCAITLTAFALGGGLSFRLFGITIGAFKIAGGILIGLNALDMVQARRSQQKETPAEQAEGIEKEDVGIMPLGVPMLAGPGAISTVMVLTGASKGSAITLGVFGATAPIVEYDIPTPNSAPHCLVAAPDGLIWFAEIGANKLGRFDPQTERFTEWPVPTVDGRPHGIAWASDGQVYFTEQHGNKIAA